MPTDKRLFWLKGSPGIGKSAFAAKLVHDANSEVVGFFKCNFQSLKSAETSASECIRTLAFQLATRLPDYRIKLLRGQQLDTETIQKKTADDLFSYLITEPLNRSEKIFESHRMVLVIDALDEAGRTENGIESNPLAELIHKHAEKLPPWLGIVVTSRPEASLEQLLGPKFQPTIVDGQTAQNLNDIKGFLDTKLDKTIAGHDRELILQQIIEKSSGTFLYVSRVIKDYDITKPDNLPNGIDDLFLQSFKRYFPDLKQYSDKTEKFLRLMVAAPGPLPKELGKEILNWENRDVTLFVTQPMASLLREMSVGLVFFHKSIQDWLLDGSRSGVYQVNHTGDKELGSFLWDEFDLYLYHDSESNKKLTSVTLWENIVIDWLPILISKIDIWNNRESIASFTNYLRLKLKFSSALTLLERHLELTKNQIGEFTEETANTFNHLGMVLDDLGRYCEAERSYLKALEIHERLTPLNEKNIADVLNNIGLLKKYIGQYQEAESYLQKAHILYEKVLDKNDLRLANIYSNLGLVFSALGRYKDAEPCYKKSIELIEEVHGANYVALVIKLNSFGLLLCELERVNEAEPLFNKALEISLKDYGNEHPRTADCYQNLGLLFSKQGRYEDAEKAWRQSLEINRLIFGEDHHSTSDLYNNLGFLFNELGRYEEGKDLFQKSLEIYQKVYGNFHPRVAMSLCNIGWALSNLGLKSEAEPYFREALNIRIKSLDPNHVDIANVQNNLGCLLNDLNRHEEAKIFFENALKIRENIFGVNAIMVGHITYELGNTAIHLGQIDEAQNYFLRGIGIFKADEVDNSNYLKYFYRAIGVMLRNEGRLEESEEYLELALEIVKNNQSHFSEAAIPELYGLGVLRMLQYRYKEAEDLLLECLQIEESIGNEDDIQATKEKLRELYQGWGKPDQLSKLKNETSLLYSK